MWALGIYLSYSVGTWAPTVPHWTVFTCAVWAVGHDCPVSDLAYCASFIESMERCLDRGGQYAARPGLMASLEAAFGAGAFEDKGDRATALPSIVLPL